MTWLLVVHAGATWFMTGLIWTIQAVHYPLFHRVGQDSFVGYEREHTRRMATLLAVPAALEVATAAALVWAAPDSVPLPLVLGAGALLAGIWITTAVVQAPLHRRLTDGFDRDRIDALTASNWWRTGAWSIRAVLVAWMLMA